MTKTSKRPKFKTQRRLRTELPGLGRPFAIKESDSKKGGSRRLSDFGVRLQEKQKICFHYGVQEKQLKNIIRRARKMKSANWVDSLMGNLESRLDNVVFRLGLARSISAARQIVRHGHVIVNGKVKSFPGFECSIGDKIEFSEKIQKSLNFEFAFKNPRLAEIPSYLSRSEAGNKITAEFIAQPHFEHVPFALESRYIAERYGHIR